MRGEERSGDERRGGERREEERAQMFVAYVTAPLLVVRSITHCHANRPAACVCHYPGHFL